MVCGIILHICDLSHEFGKLLVQSCFWITEIVTFTIVSNLFKIISLFYQILLSWTHNLKSDDFRN